MKNFIEVINLNEEKPNKVLLRKDMVVGVDEMEDKRRIVIFDSNARKSILYTATTYDEIKEALNDEEWAKKTAKRAVHELELIVGTEGTTAEIYKAFERRLTEILSGEN